MGVALAAAAARPCRDDATSPSLTHHRYRPSFGRAITTSVQTREEHDAYMRTERTILAYAIEDKYS